MFEKLKNLFSKKNSDEGFPQVKYVPLEKRDPMMGLAALIEKDLHDPTKDALSVSEYNKLKIKPKVKSKWKFAYYERTPDKKRYRNSNTERYKTLTRSIDTDRNVRVNLIKDDTSHKVAELWDDEELNLYIKVGDTPEFTLPVHEASDLLLALLKYEEMAGEGTYVRVNKTETSKT